MTRMSRHWMGLMSGAAALALLFAGEGFAQQDTTWAQDTAQAQVGQDTAQVENEVTVTLRDGQIELSDTVQAGVTRFTVVNEGTEEHGLIIQGKDVGETRMDPTEEGQQQEQQQQEEQQQEEEEAQEVRMGEEGEFMESLGRNLGPGESAVVVVNLAAGEYVAWDPVEDNRQQGMEKTFTVKEKQDTGYQPK